MPKVSLVVCTFEVIMLLCEEITIYKENNCKKWREKVTCGPQKADAAVKLNTNHIYHTIFDKY